MPWALREHQPGQLRKPQLSKPSMGSVTGLEEIFELRTAVFLQMRSSVLILRAAVCLEVRRTEAGVLTLPSKWRVWASIFLFRVSVLTKRISQLFSGRGNPKECKSDSEGGGVRKRSPGRENDMDTGSQPICILGSKLTLIQEVKVYSMTATAQEVSSFECDGSCKPL